MNQVRYDRREAERSTPLILAIGREIDERFRSLRALGRRLTRPGLAETEVQRIASEMALQKQELRRVEDELRAHGASVVGTRPLTLRVGVRDAGRPESILLQLGTLQHRRGA